MKKLLIFGDSFALDRNISSLNYLISNYNLPSSILDRHNNFKTYHSFLKESTMFSEINNFSRDACGLWQQFLLFKKLYTGKEDVVFFITSPGRLYAEKAGHVSSLENANKKLHELRTHSVNRDLEVEKILEGMIYYFMYSQDGYQEVYLQHLLVRDIIKICPHVHLIPCFEYSVSKDIMDINQGVLLNVFKLENFHWGLDTYEDLYTKYWDIRCNHMTEENHVIFAGKLLESVRHNIPIDLKVDDFVIPKLEDLEKYLIKK